MISFSSPGFLLLLHKLLPITSFASDSTCVSSSTTFLFPMFSHSITPLTGVKTFNLCIWFSGIKYTKNLFEPFSFRGNNRFLSTSSTTSLFTNKLMKLSIAFFGLMQSLHYKLGIHRLCNETCSRVHWFVSRSLLVSSHVKWMSVCVLCLSSSHFCFFCHLPLQQLETWTKTAKGRKRSKGYNILLRMPL